jgi:hypothetical protein
MRRDKKAWIGILSLVGLIAPISNSANAISVTVDNNLLSKTSVKSVDPAPKGAFLVSKVRNQVALNKYKNADRLTDHQLIDLLKAVGFRGNGLKTAWAVAKAESNGQPIRYNGNIKTGDNSYGLFQINMIGDLGPDRREKYGIKYYGELMSPVRNAEIVYAMTEGGTNWKSWKYAKTPPVQKWLKQYPNK